MQEGYREKSMTISVLNVLCGGSGNTYWEDELTTMRCANSSSQQEI
jgi:hypothetical protein